MLLTLALTLLAPLPAPTDQPAIIDERLEDEAAFEALHEAYEEAYDAWRDKLRAAEGSKERRELRKLEPTVLFRPRFEALANGGSGRALVWLVKKASKLEKRKQIPALKEEWYGRLFKDYLDAEWFGDVIGMYTKERRDVSAETIELTLASALERSEGDARARVLLGLARYRLAGKCNSGLDFYKELLAEHPDSLVAKDAQREYDLLTKFGMGAQPPDFQGKTIDGAPISLHANRGKVTVIDFWGFW
jgi:hypothetical protein